MQKWRRPRTLATMSSIQHPTDGIFPKDSGCRPPYVWCCLSLFWYCCCKRCLSRRNRKTDQHLPHEPWPVDKTAYRYETATWKRHGKLFAFTTPTLIFDTIKSHPQRRREKPNIQNNENTASSNVSASGVGGKSRDSHESLE